MDAQRRVFFANGAICAYRQQAQTSPFASVGHRQVSGRLPDINELHAMLLGDSHQGRTFRQSDMQARHDVQARPSGLLETVPPVFRHAATGGGHAHDKTARALLARLGRG